MAAKLSWADQNLDVFTTAHMRKDTYRLRLKRYVPDQPLHVLARASGTRHYSFWLLVDNFSATGFYFRVPNPSLFLPFRPLTLLETTIDLTGLVFSRPLHIQVEVVRCDEDEETGQVIGYGVRIVSIDPRQRSIFWNGFRSFGPPNVTE